VRPGEVLEIYLSNPKFRRRTVIELTEMRKADGSPGQQAAA
jgi:hypothetical protein